MNKMSEKTVYAKTKYVKSSARKTRLVLDLVRGKEAIKALDVLKFTNKAVAEDVPVSYTHLDIIEPTSKTVDSLTHLQLAAGVWIEIK